VYLTNSPKYIDAIAALYVDAYSKGTSAQYIHPAELKKYISDLLSSGSAILHADVNVLKACLLFTPFSFDVNCPKEISDTFNPANCMYIAEVMVAESFRGQGLGKLLVSEFFKAAHTSNFSDVFIRVWDQNLPALELYKKAGFAEFTTIQQLNSLKKPTLNTVR